MEKVFTLKRTRRIERDEFKKKPKTIPRAPLPKGLRTENMQLMPLDIWNFDLTDETHEHYYVLGDCDRVLGRKDAGKCPFSTNIWKNENQIVFLYFMDLKKGRDFMLRTYDPWPVVLE
jgi:hypothetical protein